MSRLLHRINQHAVSAPGRIALQSGNEYMSYATLRDEVQRRAQHLQQTGVRVLAIALPNCIDWVVWDLACLRARVTCIPVPWFFSESQRSHLLVNGGVEGIVTPNGLVQLPKTDRKLLPGICKVTYTSGSTGQPRGVCLSASALDTLAEALIDVLGEDLSHTHLSALPLSVLLENVAGLYPSLINGSTICISDCQQLMQQPDALWLALNQSAANSTILVPEFLQMLIASCTTRGVPNRSLTYIAVGGARVSLNSIERATTLGLPVYEGYGLSECGSVVSVNTPCHNKPGTAGKILPHLDTDIENDELIINNPLADHYLGDQPFTTLATGDCASVDADGYLSITGRLKNLLITSWGRNVNPEWIETELTDHTCIQQAIVTGDGNRELSALIVGSATADTASISNAIRQTNLELPGYAQIARWHRVAPLSSANGQLTGNGRPVRSAILNHHRESHHDVHIL